MASEGRAGLLPIPCCARQHRSVTRLRGVALPLVAACSESVAVNGAGAMGPSQPDSWTAGFLHPAFCIPIPTSASTPLIQGKSRMRKCARTDLCGGRSAMVVPTASTWISKRYAVTQGHCPCEASSSAAILLSVTEARSIREQAHRSRAGDFGPAHPEDPRSGTHARLGDRP